MKTLKRTIKEDERMSDTADDDDDGDDDVDVVRHLFLDNSVSLVSA